MDFVSSRVDGVPIAYDVRGDGPASIVFIHGLVGDHGDFKAQTDFFSSGHRTVALDLPGAGESGAVRSAWTMESLGEDVAGLIEHLDLWNVVLVGHSLGGNVTVEAATKLGDRVVGLIWLSSFRSLDAFPNASEKEQWFAPFHLDPLAAVEELNRRNFGPEADPLTIETVVAKARSQNPDRVMGLLTSMFQHDPTVANTLAEIDAKVFAINPDFKPVDQTSFRRHDVALTLMPDVGHFLMMEAPDALNRELQRVLGELFGTTA